MLTGYVGLGLQGVTLFHDSPLKNVRRGDDDNQQGNGQEHAA